MATSSASPPRRFTVQREGVDDVIYEGFSSVVRTTSVAILAVVWMDGEANLWSLDNNNIAVDALRRYYAEQWDRQPLINLYLSVSLDRFNVAEKG